MLLTSLALAFACTQDAAGERIRLLFLGDHGHHQPAARLQEAIGALALRGIVADWEDELARVTPARLARYDVVAVYANFPDHAAAPPEFLAALREHVAVRGRGLVALHCASACFPESPEWTRLIGARFDRHGGEVFTDETVAPEHPLLRGWQSFTTWDETYVHRDHHEAGRTVLTVRGAEREPWTWVRAEGAGRVFYTAWGHDERTWTQPGFLDLLARAALWTAGAEAAARHAGFALPPLTYEPRETVPNYEERDPPPGYQLPTTPSQAARHLAPAPGLRAALFAAEPDLVNPLAFCFDERGRLCVLESRDYPNALAADGRGRDRVVICEDRDADGRADSFITYHEGLNVPTGILAAPGGLIVAQAPDLLFLHDEDGDDRCERVSVLATGFGRSDTHAGPSSLTWGPDGRIWGAVGYAGYRGPVRGGTSASFGQGLWRCDADGAHLEFLAQFSNNTWGLGLRADGEIFGSTANGAPTFFVGVPKPLLAAADPQHPGAAPIHDFTALHPLTHLRQVDFFGGYTSAAGHRFLESPLFAPDFQGDALVCEPTGHLVARLRLVPDGSGFRARDGWNLVASTDEWFAPVQAEVGPDGAVWIADFAQFLVQHNPTPTPEWGGFRAANGAGNAHENPLRDEAHGRIWRLLPAEAPLGAVPLPRVEPPPRTRHSLWSPDPAERKRALADEALPLTPRDLLESGVLDDAALDVRRWAFLAAARLPADPALGAALAAQALQPAVHRDAWLPTALLAAATPHAEGFLAALAPALRAEAAAAAEPGPNLVSNPGFEDADAAVPEQPAAWRPRTYGGRAEHAWVDGAGRGGGRALRIASERGSDTSWFTDLTVEPRTRYRLSAWIRAEPGFAPLGDALGALLNLHGRGQTVSTAVRAPADWTRVELEFETGPQERAVSLNCLYGGWGQAVGAALWDDLELRALGAGFTVSGLAGRVARARGLALPAGAPEESGGPPLDEGGDPARGAEVFWKHPVAACSACHAIGGLGGAVGPELSQVGARLTRPQLLQSILDPNAALAAGWPGEVSAMPVLRPFLTDAELRDLVAFLAAQTGPEK
jgi:putative membrane-bound dehydrogenase-like protein